MQGLRITPAKAGVHSSLREMLRSWHGFFGKLAKVLCLADPWVPAFAGMDEK